MATLPIEKTSRAFESAFLALVHDALVSTLCTTPDVFLAALGTLEQGGAFAS